MKAQRKAKRGPTAVDPLKGPEAQKRNGSKAVKRGEPRADGTPMVKKSIYMTEAVATRLATFCASKRLFESAYVEELIWKALGRG